MASSLSQVNISSTLSTTSLRVHQHCSFTMESDP